MRPPARAAILNLMGGGTAVRSRSLEDARMTDQIGIVAEIRPGRRAALEHLLAQGPPFDLAREGFEHHEVLLGEEDVVFLFTGPGARSQLERMAASRSFLAEIGRMSTILSAPRLLDRTFEWSSRPSLAPRD